MTATRIALPFVVLALAACSLAPVGQSAAAAPSAGPLTGMLRDASQGRPLACAALSFRGDGRPMRDAITDRQGKFYVELPDLGTYDTWLLLPGWVPMNVGTATLSGNAGMPADMDVAMSPVITQDRRVPVYITFSGVTRGLRNANDGPWILSPTTTMHRPRREPTIEVRVNDAPRRGTFVQFVADSTGSPDFATMVFESGMDRYVRQPVLQALMRLKFFPEVGKTSQCLLVRLPVDVVVSDRRR